jgi:hypothetical protein
MDLKSVYEWIKTNPMKPAFMIAELARLYKNINCNITLTGNGELLFLHEVSKDDPKYVSLILTNRLGEDLLSFENLLLEGSGVLAYIFNGECFMLPIKSATLPSSVPDIRDIGKDDGNFIITNENLDIIVSKRVDKPEETDIIQPDQVNHNKPRGRKRKV